MDYLKNIGFTSEEIENINESAPTKVIDLLKENYKLVTQNINFIKDLGVSNYKEIFSKFVISARIRCRDSKAVQ